MSSDVEPIYTTVAHTGIHELHFRGQRVFADLLGTTSLSQMTALSIGGRLHTDNELAAIDDIVTAMSSADPRLWPFKITRLASACGTAAYGVACTLVASEGGIFGVNRLRQCADFLASLQAADMAERATDDQIRTALKTAGNSFGVLYRAKDERFEALASQTAKRKRDNLPFFVLCMRMVAIAREQQLEPHVFLGVAAVTLDLGWAPESVAMLALLLLFHDALPNAAEGAQQQPTSLQELPYAPHVRYEGPTPRISSRAVARAASGAQP